MPNRTKDDLWERQPGESAQAYEAFAIYRDMGSNRSLRVVAEQLSKSDTLIKRWSREKKWGERCRAYDNHLDDVARQEALRKYKKMRTRHIGIALQLQEKALAELKNLPDGSMTPKDIIQFLDKATELERDNRMEEAGVTAGGKTAEEQEETTLSLADEIAAAQGFGAVGIYWHDKAAIVHTDTRGGKATWLCVQPGVYPSTTYNKFVLPTIEQGCEGAANRAATVMLQRLLGIPHDGSFGPATTKALMTAQRKHGLVPDGICGPKSWTALSGADKYL